MTNSHSHFHTIPQEDAPKKINLVVEISKGESFNKYEYDQELGILKFDRALFSPVYYPVNYCDIPGTWNSSDGDPLDAVIYSSGPIHPYILVKGRVIGMMEMIDNDETDHKIVCVADKDPRYKHVTHVDQLTEFERKDLQTFFETYKHVQTGPGTVKVGRFLGPEEAYKVIEEAVKAYKVKFSE